MVSEHTLTPSHIPRHTLTPLHTFKVHYIMLAECCVDIDSEEEFIPMSTLSQNIILPAHYA